MTTIRTPVKFEQPRSPYRQVGEVTKKAFLKMGGIPGPSGKVLLYGGTGDRARNVDAAVKLYGWNGSAILGGGIERRNGRISILEGTGQEVISLGAAAGFKMAGRISLRKSPNGPETASLSAQGVFHLGGNGANALARLYGPNANPGNWAEAGITLDGKGGALMLGANGVNGGVALFPAEAPNHADWNNASIHLNGDAGDIILRNADCAEDFDVAAAESITPGTVMVINEDGGMRESTQPYDRRVSGVVSGDGTKGPGIVLGRRAERENRLPIALVGKVFCRVDADAEPIAVGDLLTTSSTPGHAMKADDPLKAFGAVIGKALRPLKEGKGLIPILVALQ